MSKMTKTCNFNQVFDYDVISEDCDECLEDNSFDF